MKEKKCVECKYDHPDFAGSYCLHCTRVENRKDYFTKKPVSFDVWWEDIATGTFGVRMEQAEYIWNEAQENK